MRRIRPAATSEPSFPELIARVPDPPALAPTKRRLSGLIERHAMLADEHDMLRAAAYGVPTAGPVFEAQKENAAARQQVAADIAEQRAALADARGERRARIREALASRLSAAEAEVLSAFDTLLHAWIVLDGYNSAVHAAGLPELVRRHPTANQLGMLLRKVVGDAAGKAAVAGVIASLSAPPLESLAAE